MADPPRDEDDEPAEPASRFLIILWDHLERATDLSTGTDALDRLDEVLLHCDAASAVIREWQAQRR